MFVPEWLLVLIVIGIFVRPSKLAEWVGVLVLLGVAAAIAYALILGGFILHEQFQHGDRWAMAIVLGVGATVAAVFFLTALSCLMDVVGKAFRKKSGA